MLVLLRRVTTLALALGGTIAGLLLISVLSKTQYTHLEVERGALALALILFTAAYAVEHRRFSLHWLGIPAYLLSCLAVFWVVPAWINGVFKGFAPASPEEAVLAFWYGIANLILVAAVSAAAWYTVSRLSKASHAANLR